MGIVRQFAVETPYLRYTGDVIPPSKAHAARRSNARALGLVGALCALVGSVFVGAAVGPAAAAKEGTGPVDVLYAGSLVGLMEQGIGPAFDAETGDTFSGFSGGSDALASEIKGKTQLADVFVSASPAVNATLEGDANGDWVSWYATFASSPLVIGYNPTSPFAAALRSKPWYQVVTEPGFVLGRTDPATDPKGELAVEALTRAASEYHQPSLAQLTTGTSGVYPEQSLVGLLQAGQVGAGFFYASEAKAAGIPTISLGSIHYQGEYTVTVVNRAPHAKAAQAFVAFLFGRLGRSILDHDGLRLMTPPKVTGAGKVPRALRASLRSK
jgi:molybdate/tungstate transport system substrate-binding protein